MVSTDFLYMTSNQFEQLEAQLKTLGTRANLSLRKKTEIRDRVFRSIGQIELADAIAAGESKSKLFVSLDHLKRALIPHKLSFSMPATVATIILVFLGSITMGAFAQSARPGAALFGVKKVFESIELAFVRDPIDKANYRLSIADQRLKYLEEGGAQALQQILRESQVALVSAREALNQAQVAYGDDEASTADLVDRFSALLQDQRKLLASLEGQSDSEEVKQTIVAIREALAEPTNTSAVTAPATSSTATGSTSNTATATNEEPVEALPDGRYTSLAVRVITTNGRPAVVIGGVVYPVSDSTVNLLPYVGFNLTVSGQITRGTINIDTVISGSGAIISPDTNLGAS